MTSKFYVWPRKIIGHLFYTTSSFVHHFNSIGEFKLKLQSGNAQFRWKLAIFVSRVTLKFDGWPWKTILYCIKLCASFQSHGSIQAGVTVRKRSIRVKIGHFCPVWPSNLMNHIKNNRAPLLYYIKLRASFQSHGSIQTGVTVRKRSIRVKIGNFFVPCDLEIWWMTFKNNRVPLLRFVSSFVRHFRAIDEFKLALQSVKAQFGSNVTLKFDKWP